MPRTSKRRTSRSTSYTARRPTPHNSDPLSTDRDGPLTAATIPELGALTVKTLQRHLAARQLATSGVKTTLVRRLYDAMHAGESSAVSSTISPTQTTVTWNSQSLSSSQVTPLSTSTQPADTVNPGNITPAQVSVLLQVLSQALQTDASSMQQLPTTAMSSQPINRVLPSYSTAQHHNRTITTQSVPGPTTSIQVSNDDALSTASSISPIIGGTQANSPDPALSQSLPPVPAALQQRILRGEYIDFNTLLPEVMFSVVTSTPSPNASRPTVQSPKITSFSSWLDAWNTYIATIVAHNSDRASELLGYQRLIHSASKHFSTSTWLKYDAQFRILAAYNPQLRWDLRHSELWLDSLAIQTGSSLSTRTRWPCTYCGSTYHFPDRCPRCPFRPSQQDSGIGTAQRGSGPTLPQRDSGSRSLTCRDFNNGTCNRNPCRYKHDCYICGSPSHPARRCNGQSSSASN